MNWEPPDSDYKALSQLSINWYNPFWWVWPSMPKVLKITSIQCLCNISKNNWVMKLLFSMLIDLKVSYKWIVLFLMGLAMHAQITCITLYYLWNILRKKSRMKLGTYWFREWLVLALLLQFVVHPMFSHHWPFSSVIMESIPSVFFILLFV